VPSLDDHVVDAWLIHSDWERASDLLDEQQGDTCDACGQTGSLNDANARLAGDSMQLCDDCNGGDD
jgi:hypothetical protein